MVIDVRAPRTYWARYQDERRPLRRSRSDRERVMASIQLVRPCSGGGRRPYRALATVPVTGLRLAGAPAVPEGPAGRRQGRWGGGASLDPRERRPSALPGRAGA